MMKWMLSLTIMGFLAVLGWLGSTEFTSWIQDQAWVSATDTGEQAMLGPQQERWWAFQTKPGWGFLWVLAPGLMIGAALGAWLTVMIGWPVLRFGAQADAESTVQDQVRQAEKREHQAQECIQEANNRYLEALERERQAQQQLEQAQQEQKAARQQIASAEAKVRQERERRQAAQRAYGKAKAARDNARKKLEQLKTDRVPA